MSSQNFQALPELFTLAEIRLLKVLYHELSLEELAIFFAKPKESITDMAKELALKKEVPNG